MTTADTALDVAIGAAGAAGLLLLTTGYLWVQVRRMRRAQKVVIGSKSATIFNDSPGAPPLIELVAAN